MNITKKITNEQKCLQQSVKLFKACTLLSTDNREIIMWRSSCRKAFDDLRSTQHSLSSVCCFTTDVNDPYCQTPCLYLTLHACDEWCLSVRSSAIVYFICWAQAASPTGLCVCASVCLISLWSIVKHRLSTLGQLSLAIPAWVDALSTSVSWDVNGHTRQCTGPVSVVWPCKLVSGWRLRKCRSVPANGP